MRKPRNVLRIGFGLLSSVLGCLLIFALLDAMNNQEGPEKPGDDGSSMGVQMTPEKKPPKTQKRIVKKRKVKRSSKPQAPVPTLAAALTGNSFGIPDLVGAGLADQIASSLVEEDAVKNMVMTEDAVDVLPKPVFKKPPEYPKRAIAKNMTGTVLLRVLIGNTGEVVKVKVKKATPAGIFEECAVAAMQDWQFQPAYYQGKAVKIWAEIPFNFELG
jgi:protein TonB